MPDCVRNGYVAYIFSSISTGFSIFMGYYAQF